MQRQPKAIRQQQLQHLQQLRLPYRLIRFRQNVESETVDPLRSAEYLRLRDSIRVPDASFQTDVVDREQSVPPVLARDFTPFRASRLHRGDFERSSL